MLSAALVHQREETLGQILDSTQSLYTLFHTYIRLHSKLALVSSPQHALRFPFPGACPWGSCSARETHPLGLKRHDVIVRALEARTTAFELLAQHADATVLAAVGPTPLGRGLVAGRSIAPRDPVVSLPVHNTLLVADDPIDGISIFSDRQHRRWQELHGSLPEQLLEFLQGGKVDQPSLEAHSVLQYLWTSVGIASVGVASGPSQVMQLVQAGRCMSVGSQLSQDTCSGMSASINQA